MQEKKKTIQGRDATNGNKRQGRLGKDYEGRPGSGKQHRDETRPWRRQKQDLLHMDIEDLRDYLLDTEM